MIEELPFVIVCYFRAIWRSIRLMAPVAGHDFIEAKPAPGQPRHVQVLKCETCDVVSIAWSKCGKCSSEDSARD